MMGKADLRVFSEDDGPRAETQPDVPKGPELNFLPIEEHIPVVRQSMGNVMEIPAELQGGHAIVIPSDPANARLVQEHIEQLLTKAECPANDLFAIKLALEEAIVNAIKHGHEYDRNKKLTIIYAVQRDKLLFFIQDEGNGFDPNDVPDPTAIENLERPCGRGLMLMRHYMSHTRYGLQGKSLFLVKNFSRS